MRARALEPAPYSRPFRAPTSPIAEFDAEDDVHGPCVASRAIASSRSGATAHMPRGVTGWAKAETPTVYS
jgi:hypothetical protein